MHPISSFDASKSTESSESVRVLIVDDESEIQALATQALQPLHYDVVTAAHGRAALEALSARPFDIILTDLRMPIMDGVELTRILLRQYPDVPIVIITGYGDIHSVRELMDMGVSDFLMKPYRPSELPIIITRNLRRRQREKRQSLEQQTLIQRTYDATLDALLGLLEVRDPETEGHTKRVTAYTMALVSALGVDSFRFPAIERGALLHDVGKIGVRDSILLKPGPLTPEEWQEIRKHPLIGYEIVSKFEFLKESTPIILYHHEHYNGKGYPQGLKGDEIPLEARAFTVVDAFDALTSDRPYRQACSYSEAAAEIARCSGEQFDPRVVETFFNIPEKHWQVIRRHVTKP